jgi:hypothetical protein
MLLIRREKEISKICLFPGLVQPFQFAQAQRRSSTRLSGKGLAYGRFIRRSTASPLRSVLR